MKIMIADDEVIIRNGLSQVINWQEIGLQLLEPAASAEEALARIDQEKPDILLTDIRMSGMTGLQLAEEAMRRLPQLEVIILTGYDDFAYTQQAIRQHVSDYLLKTSRPEEIVKTVLKAKQKAEEKRQSLSRDYRSRQHERNQQWINWVVHGERSAVQPQWLPHSPTGQWLVLLAEADGWGAAGRDQSLLQFAVNNAVRDLLNCASFIYEGRIVMVVPAARDEFERRQRSGDLTRLGKILKCRLFAAGGLVKFDPEQLCDSYATALEAITYRPLLRASVWDFGDIEGRRGGKAVCSQEEEKQLSAILLEDDPMALKRWVRRYVDALLADEEATPQSLQASLQSVALAAHRWLDRVLSSVRSKHAGEHAALPYRNDEDQDGSESLFQHLFDLMKYCHQQLEDGKISHVQRAIVFIEEQVGRELSLTQVADHVHLHPNHLSELFKKETGIKFVDYVTRTRMQRASELLAATPAKISEIALSVGYEDVKYFGQMFKKFAGSTPSRYRERMSGRRGL